MVGLRSVGLLAIAVHKLLEETDGNSEEDKINDKLPARDTLVLPPHYIKIIELMGD